MARDEMGMPPPVGRGRRGPEMMSDDPSIQGKLDKLAGMGGGMGGEAGPVDDQQVAQLVMGGAQQLMQAMQMKPELQPFISQALQIIQQGVQGMAGAEAPPEGGETGGGKPKKKKRPSPPTEEEAGGGMDQFAGAY